MENKFEKSFSDGENIQQPEKRTRTARILAPLLMGCVLLGCGGKKEKAPVTDTAPEAATEQLIVEEAEKISSVKEKLNKVVAEGARGDDYERTFAQKDATPEEQRAYLARRALEKIEKREEIAEFLLKPAEDIPPLRFLQGFLSKDDAGNLRSRISEQFGKIRDESPELSMEERIEKYHETESKIAYDSLVESEGLLMANVIVLKANEMHKAEQAKEATTMLKELIKSDGNAESLDEVEAGIKEFDAKEKAAEEDAKPDLKEAKAIKSLIKELID